MFLRFVAVVQVLVAGFSLALAGWPEKADVDAHAAHAKTMAALGPRAPVSPGPAPMIEVGRFAFPAPLEERGAMAALPGTGIVAVLNRHNALVTQDLLTGERVQELPTGGHVGSGGWADTLAVTGRDDSRRLIVGVYGAGSEAPPVDVYDASDARHLVRIATTDPCGRGAIAPEQGTYGFSWGDACGNVFEIDTGRVVANLADRVSAAAFAGGSRIALVDPNAWGNGVPLFRLWDLTEPRYPALLFEAVLDGSSTSILVDRAARFAVLGGYGMPVQIRDLVTGELLHTWPVEDGPPPQLALSESAGHPVLAIGVFGRIELWDLTDPREPGHVGDVPAQMFLRDEWQTWIGSDQPLAAFPGRPWLAVVSFDTNEMVVADVTTAAIVGRWSPAPALASSLVVDEVGPDALVALRSLRQTWDEVLVAGGAAHLDAVRVSAPSDPRLASRYERPGLGSTADVVTQGGRLIAGFDPMQNAIVVGDLATGAVIASGGLSVPPQVFDEWSGGRIDFDGTWLVVTTAGALELFEVRPPELLSRLTVRKPAGGYLGSTVLLPEGCVATLSGARFRSMCADGREGALELPSIAEKLLVSPDATHLLTSPCDEWVTWDTGLRATMLDVHDPAAPTVAWSGPAGTKFATFVRDGSVVALTRPGDTYYMSYAPELVDAATGLPLGAQAEPVYPFFYYAPAVTLDNDGAGRLVYWQWTWSGWENVMYDVSAATPVLVGTSAEYFDEPSFARRDGGSWFEVHDDWLGAPNAMLVGRADLGYDQRGPVEVTDVLPLRHGFVVGPRRSLPGAWTHAVPFLVLRDPTMNRPPVAVAGDDLRVECERASTTTLDGSRSTDPDSTPGTSDDIATYAWTLDGADAGREPIVSVAVDLGAHAATLTLTDRLDATATDAVAIDVVDTRAPALAAALEPVFDGTVWRNQWRVTGEGDDACDGTIAVAEDLLVLPFDALGATVTFRAADATTMTVRRSARGTTVVLAGPDHGLLVATWEFARAHGALRVPHATPVGLLGAPGVADVIARYALDASGLVTRGEAADHRFRVTATDRAGNAAAIALSLEEARAALCREVPANTVCAKR